MCLGGGIYSLSQDDGFVEVKHKKMPKVNRWTEFPLKFGQAAVSSSRETAVSNRCVSRNCVSRDCQKREKEGAERVRGVCIGSVNIMQGSSVIEQKGYEVIRVNVDSGAIDSCIPPNVASMFKVRSTKMSENGGYYTSASGGVIYNEGERDVRGVTDDAQELGMTFQVAKVRGPLGSVRRICEAGNRVVFDDDGDGSYIENKTSKKRVKIEKVKGVYLLNLWVKKSEVREVNSVSELANSNSSFAMLGQLI
jgi:hypothetical protein